MMLKHLNSYLEKKGKKPCLTLRKLIMPDVQAFKCNLLKWTYYFLENVE